MSKQVFSIENHSKSFDSLVQILKNDFGIYVYEDKSLAAPDVSFVVSDKQIDEKDLTTVFESFYNPR
jgi:hypothetical protein